MDVTDSVFLVDAFGTVVGDARYNTACDFNGAGAVDVVDLLDMVSNIGVLRSMPSYPLIPDRSDTLMQTTLRITRHSSISGSMCS
jgi:hypothetical protein